MFAVENIVCRMVFDDFDLFAEGVYKYMYASAGFVNIYRFGYVHRRLFSVVDWNDFVIPWFRIKIPSGFF